MSELMKWSGSKDSQSDSIIEYIPKDIKNYYEPFVGGGSIFLKLLETRNIENYFISDLNEDLINIYLLIKNDPDKLIENYNIHYNNFNLSDIEYRKTYFNDIRSKYNKNRDASDFYWLQRSCTNGAPRYNLKGDYNQSCHFTRPGMEPKKVENIIRKYSKLFNDNNVNFYHSDYKDIKYNGFVYLDPPYQATKGMYFSNFDNVEFITWINKLDSKWLLSYDGKVNNIEVEHNKPNFKTQKYLKSGNSSFRRVIGNSNDSIVYESIYMNF